MTEGGRQRRHDGSAKRVQLTSGDHGDRKTRGKGRGKVTSYKAVSSDRHQSERFQEALRASEARRLQRQAERESIERVSDFKGAIPPGWPTQVDAPGANGGEWEQSATKWLFEQVPGEWRDGRNGRQYRQHPIMLARDADYLLGGQLEGLRAAYRTARVELADHFQPEQIEEQLKMYAEEGPRLEQLRRQVQLVHDALTGVRWVPKTPTSWQNLD